MYTTSLFSFDADVQQVVIQAGGCFQDVFSQIRFGAFQQAAGLLNTDSLDLQLRLEHDFGGNDLIGCWHVNTSSTVRETSSPITASWFAKKEVRTIADPGVKELVIGSDSGNELNLFCQQLLLEQLRGHLLPLMFPTTGLLCGIVTWWP